MLSVITFILSFAIVVILTFTLLLALPKKGAESKKRTWIDALMGVPKKKVERGPRPPLVHPDVIKDREERAKRAKAEQAEENKIEIEVTFKDSE